MQLKSPNKELSAKATLSNPSSGTLNSNTIEGLTADNTTEYQVTWLFGNDGITNSSTVRFVGRIF